MKPSRALPAGTKSEIITTRADDGAVLKARRDSEEAMVSFFLVVMVVCVFQLTKIGYYIKRGEASIIFNGCALHLLSGSQCPLEGRED